MSDVSTTTASRKLDLLAWKRVTHRQTCGAAPTMTRTDALSQVAIEFHCATCGECFGEIFTDDEARALGISVEDWMTRVTADKRMH